VRGEHLGQCEPQHVAGWAPAGRGEHLRQCEPQHVAGWAPPGEASISRRFHWHSSSSSNDTLTKAMKEKDAPTADVVRMIKRRSASGEPRRASPGRSTTRSSSMSSAPIASSSRRRWWSSRRWASAGRRARGAAPLRARVLRAVTCPREWTRWRCARWSASGLDTLKIADAKQVGRLIGDVMKTHKGQVDAAEVKRVAEEMLKARPPATRTTA